MVAARVTYLENVLCVTFQPFESRKLKDREKQSGNRRLRWIWNVVCRNTVGHTITQYNRATSYLAWTDR